jgi:hypothetical protein
VKIASHLETPCIQGFEVTPEAFQILVWRNIPPIQIGGTPHFERLSLWVKRQAKGTELDNSINLIERTAV